MPSFFSSIIEEPEWGSQQHPSSGRVKLKYLLECGQPTAIFSDPEISSDLYRSQVVPDRRLEAIAPPRGYAYGFLDAILLIWRHHGIKVLVPICTSILAMAMSNVVLDSSTWVLSIYLAAVYSF